MVIDKMDLLELQNQLAARMSDGLDLQSTARIALQIAIQAAGMDSGGVYLVQHNPDRLVLQSESGFSREFVESIRTYSNQSDRWHMIMKGKSIYSNYEQLPLEKNILLQQEGIQSVAILPLIHQNRVVGSLQMASHEEREIDPAQKKVLETIAMQLGGYFQRANQMEELSRKLINFQTLVEASDEAMVVISFSGEIHFCNELFAFLFDQTPADVIGANLETYYHSQNSSTFQDFLDALVAEPEVRRTIELTGTQEGSQSVDLYGSFHMWNFEPAIFLFVAMRHGDISLQQQDDRQEIKYLFDLLPTATLVINTHTFEILYGNRGFHDLFAVSADELTGKNFLQFFSDQDYIRLIDALREKGLYGLVDGQGWHQIRKDGSILHTILNIYPIEWVVQPAALVFIEKKETSRLDDNSLNAGRYREIINLQTDLVVRFTRDGMITFVNQAYCEMLNQESSRLIGRSLFDYLQPADVAVVKAHLSQISFDNPVIQSRNQLIDGKGNWRYINWIDRGIFQGQELVEIQGAGRDITGQTQKSLLKETMEQRFQNLVEELPGVVYVMHSESQRMIYLSPQFEGLTGYHLDEVYNDPDFIRNHILPDDYESVRYTLKKRIAGEFVPYLEYRFRKKNGEIIWVQEISSILETKDGVKLLQGLVLDVTENHMTRVRIDYYAKFERLINEISLALSNVRPYQWDALLLDILKSIGMLLGVDRSYIFCTNDEGTTISNTHEWCAEGISPQRDNLQDLPLDRVVFWVSSMNDSDVVMVEDVDTIEDLYSDSRELLQSQSIKSLLLVAMKRNQKLCGFIGFDSVLTYKTWDDQATILLKTVSQMVLNTKDRISPQKPSMNV